ncbi:DUF6270 domain-containing protein [Brachybacterium phenoliresistens]|uniref:DUF6270 domain-containing protein n=1 Tax=Brachybacterium phenoliresistens TaxID=396014 RepID=UPI0031E17D4C
MSTRIFIYGSCVTRDAVDFWDPDQLEMAGYIARQSLISATSPAGDIDQWRLSQIESSFQRRMLRGDIESSIIPALDAARDDYDVILWDLTDERNGVQSLPGGGWVTRLRNFEKENLFKGTLGEIITTADPDHRRMWNSALDRFLGHLADLDLLDRLILNDTRWAEQDDTGAPFSPTETFLNEHLARMTSSITAAGVPVVSTPAEALTAAARHKWDRAPFHYVDEVYRTMTERLLSTTSAMGF